MGSILFKFAICFLILRPGAGNFNLFLSQAEVRKLMGKQVSMYFVLHLYRYIDFERG